jgi:cytochrome c553
MHNAVKSGSSALMLLGALAAAGPASAIDPPPPGRLLASHCAQCHGTDGRAVRFKSLAGKDNIYNELRQMQFSDKNKIMHLQARGYTDEQARLIGDYYASIPEHAD